MVQVVFEKEKRSVDMSSSEYMYTLRAFILNKLVTNKRTTKKREEEIDEKKALEKFTLHATEFIGMSVKSFARTVQKGEPGG
jgi:hypothetical protein